MPQLVLVAVQNMNRPMSKLRKLLAEKFERDILASLEYGTSWIATIVKSAPMLGLFGTVLGMINAFAKIASSQGGTDPTKLANDISFALLTTALGLVIAIPLVMAGNLIHIRIGKLQDSVQHDLGQFLEDVEETQAAGGGAAPLRATRGRGQSVKRHSASFGGEEDSLANKKRGDSEADLDITPMIDVVFLLLIFFMVTSTMQSKRELDVPPAKHGAKVDSSTATILTINRPEDPDASPTVIFSNGNEGTLDDVKGDVEAGLAKGKNRVILKADRDVLHGVILKVMRKANEVEGVAI